MGYLSSNKNKQIISIDDDDQNAQSGSSSRGRIALVYSPNAQSGPSSRGPIGPDPNAQSRSWRRGPIVSEGINPQAGLPSRALVGRDPNNVQSGSSVGGPSFLGPNVQFGSSSRGLIGYGSNSQIGSSSRGPISHGTNIQFGSYESNFHILEDGIPHQSNTLFGSSTTATIAHESSNIQFGSSSSRGPIFRDSNFQLGSSSRSGPSGHESNFQLGSSRGITSRDEELNNMNGHNGSINDPENDTSFPDDVDCTLRLGMSSGTSSAKARASGTSPAARPNTRSRFSSGPPYPQIIDNQLVAVNNGGRPQCMNRWGFNMFRYEAAERMNNVQFHGMIHGTHQMRRPPMCNPPLGPIFPLPPPVPLLFAPQPPPPMFLQRPNDILGLVNANLAAGLFANPLNNGSQQPPEPKRCMACHTTSTPLWRNGPAGPKTLCNACGIRYKKETKKLSFSYNQLGLD